MATSTTRRFFIITLVLMACSLGPLQSAFATPVLQIDSSGQLTGANGVNVNGTFYDVGFEDGTCASLFSGCNETSDFVFHNKSSTIDAANALLGQVFTDTPSGLFGSNPLLTSGCSTNPFDTCVIATPWRGVTSRTGFGKIEAVIAANRSGSLAGSVNALASFTTIDDFSLHNDAVWAVWSVSSVPEPNTPLLLLTGGAALFAWQRKSHQGQFRQTLAS